MEVQQYFQQLQSVLGAAAPRLQALFEKPGSQELLADVQWGLLQRFAARGIKLAMGLQSGGGDGGDSGSGGSEGGSSRAGRASAPALQQGAQPA